MILLCFALLREARATIEKLGAQPTEERAHRWLDGEVPILYTFPQGKILLTNAGAQNAYNAIMKWGPNSTHIYNIGIAGALADLPLFSTHQIGSVLCLNNPPLSLSGQARLFTTDKPIHDCQTKNALVTRADLVDMEGYGVVKAAQVLHISCTLWRVVSDFCEEGGSELIRKNIPTLSNKLAQLAVQKIY